MAEFLKTFEEAAWPSSRRCFSECAVRSLSEGGSEWGEGGSVPCWQVGTKGVLETHAVPSPHWRTRFPASISHPGNRTERDFEGGQRRGGFEGDERSGFEGSCERGSTFASNRNKSTSKRRPGVTLMTKKPKKSEISQDAHYDSVLGDISKVIDAARRSSARSVNSIMTAAYWLIGRRIVEFEQSGELRAEYGTSLLKRLSADLMTRFGRGFSVDNLETMRLLYLAYSRQEISETVSGKSDERKKSATPSRNFNLPALTTAFPLSWSHYVLLMRRTRSKEARTFYEFEALRGGWSVRQLERQIDSQFYERTALSKNKASILTKAQKARPEDRVFPEEEIKDPFVLEFLGLKDEYSETNLEEGLIRHLETFLLELGGDFCFIGRQRRLRIGDEWYRVDLVFFHRRLRCLVIIDLKIGRFTHADAGQMHLYLNYAREHWVREGENPPVGLILCAQKDEAVAWYALEGLPNKVMASEYRTALPDEKELAAEIERTQALLQDRKRIALTSREAVQTKKSVKTKEPLGGEKGAAKGPKGT
jgi:predicted nuclease of restriction endonuclease-like (RecB) superfamily